MKPLLVFIFLIVAISIVPLSFAAQSNLGVFKQNTCINLLENCADCTYLNLTSVIYPDSTFLLNENSEMTQTGSVYNYSICNTTQIGNYIYCVIGDPSGVIKTDCVNFEVNDRGVAIKDNTTNIAIIGVLIMIILLGAFFTFYLDNNLKFAFFLGTILATVFSLNLISNVASTAGASQTIVDLLFFGYRIGLYIFWALFLYVLFKLTMELRVRDNRVPTQGSPLKMARENRLKRQGRWQ